TPAYLAKSSARGAIRERMTELLAIGSISLPVVRRSPRGALRLFYTRRQGSEEQAILYVRDELGGIERVLVDPTLGTDSTTALDWFEPSDDGTLVAYGLSEKGTEDSTLRVRDVASGSDLADVIDRTRYESLAWKPRNSGFFYSRYPEPTTVPAGEERLHRKIYEHVLGTDPQKDRLVFGSELDPTDFPGCATSPKGSWLLVSVSRGFSESALYLAATRDKTEGFARISPAGKALYSGIPREDRLFVLTNDMAPRYRIFAVDPRRPQKEHWRLVVPEHAEDVIRTFDVIGRHILVSYLHRGLTRLARFSLDGKPEGDLSLPALGTSDGFSGLPDGNDAFYAFESFVVPREVRRFDLGKQKDSSFLRVHSDIPSNDYVVESFTARAHDGTEIPYQLVRQARRPLGDGLAKTLLYGYGGFNQIVEPRFSRPVQVFLEQGGVYVQAQLRGGGEFGESWHRAGQLTQKQNTFDDFASVAEDLIERKVTTPAELAILGRSNGGLLVAAALTQHPELYRAAVAQVPLTDMLRYPRFLIGKLWVSEYGSPDNEPEFRALLAYSPYHRVRPGVSYPSTLITTAESDTRVDPLHARKFAAALQHATSSRRPILLRTERSAGHGAGIPRSKQVDELTDVYTFLFAELGLQIPPQTR
ncbi:MAG TPA: prolyl oligopeptidase family serine peptidase, partial [Polyangiaceae bacterium]|nr:prolyl oligopeptidase family serine peptidase [Polyangiaceae bacterium]